MWIPQPLGTSKTLRPLDPTIDENLGEAVTDPRVPTLTGVEDTRALGAPPPLGSPHTVLENREDPLDPPEEGFEEG